MIYCIFFMLTDIKYSKYAGNLKKLLRFFYKYELLTNFLYLEE